MIVYQVERAYCDECGTGVSVYPGGLEQFQHKRGEYVLDDTCCYKHGIIPFERALFRSGNPADYPIATSPPRLDRLSRNASFVFKLRDAKVDFICADMPDATPLTIGIMAVLAENERQLISSRTKAALAAKRARNQPLGNPSNFTEAGRAKGKEANQNNALKHERNVQARNLVKLYHDMGWSLNQIADKLNELGYRTRRECKFTSRAIFRLLPVKESLVT